MKLSEVASIVSGYAFKSGDFTDEGVPVIKIGNIRNGSVEVESNNTQFLPKQLADATNKKFQVRRGDILISLTGSHMTQPNSVVGRVGQYRYPFVSMLNQRAGKVVASDARRIDNQYLYYLLSTKSARMGIAMLAHGAANQANVSPKDIPKLQFYIEQDVNTQKKIAAILFTYDQLLETNERRIAVLEKLAKEIYTEWFVRMRFHGHQSHEMIRSDIGRIPRSWDVGTIGDLCVSINDGDWIETKDQGGDDFRLLQVSNIGDGGFRETGNFRFISQDTFDRLRCQEVVEGDLLISRMPDPIGRAWRVTPMPWRMITAVDVAIAKPNLDVSAPGFLHYYLNSEWHIGMAETNSTGTTRPRISRKALCKIPLFIPPVKLQRDFESIVGPIYSLSVKLKTMNDNLRRSRDLLLDRLISGSLSVSDLQIVHPSATPIRQDKMVSEELVHA